MCVDTKIFDFVMVTSPARARAGKLREVTDEPLALILMAMRDWVDTQDYRLRLSLLEVSSVFKIPRADVELFARKADEKYGMDSEESLEKFVAAELYARDWTDYVL